MDVRTIGVRGGTIVLIVDPAAQFAGRTPPEGTCTPLRRSGLQHRPKQSHSHTVKEFLAKRLHLVDGTFELYRAHYSKRPDSADKATKGIVQSMRGLMADKQEEVTHMAVAFDNPIRSFRNDLFDAYKSDEGVPDILRSQFDSAEDAIRALGITVWSMDHFECDDALATAAVKYKEDFEQIRILSPDKDFGQCLDGTRVVMVDRIRKTVTDENEMRRKRGIGPESLADWLALTGDTADGIPGLPGFGEKTASTLLAKFKHVEQIPDDATLWENVRGADKLVEVLKNSRIDVALYKRLATLSTDVPLKEAARDLAIPSRSG